MPASALILIIILGVLVAAAFLVAWRLDARRATSVATDEERLDVDPDMSTKPVDHRHPE